MARSSPARAKSGLAQGDRRRRIVGEQLFDAWIAIERDVLVIQHRIRIGHGRRHQRARVVWSRRDDDLQPGRAIEPGLRILRVERAGVAQPAEGHADDHRHLAAPAVPDLGGVVDQLIEAGRDEVVELDLADRPLPASAGADAHAEDGAFSERRS
jgi:hypothetical protein